MARHMARHERRRANRPSVGVVVGLSLAAVAVLVGVLILALWPRGRSASGEGEPAMASESMMRNESTNALNDGDALEGPANGLGSSSELAQMFQAGEVRSVRLIGDSITAGYGTDGYEDANLLGEGTIVYDDGEGTVRYETPASVACWANAFREYAGEHGVDSFVNAGINGEFMKTLAEHPDAWLSDGADVVFVALGTNDAGYYGHGEFRAYAEEGLAAAARVSKHVVVLSPVRDLRPEYLLVEPAAELGDDLQAICELNGYLFVDTRESVTPSMFNSDGLHPTTEGSLAIWQCIQDTLGLCN